MTLFVSVLLAAFLAAPADPPRPRITGLAHVGLYVHDIEKARAYYHDFLGYTEVTPLKNDDGTLRLTFFKINDRQFVEVFPERSPGTDRLAHIAIETDDAEALRVYLKSRGVAVPDKAALGRTGNIAFTVKDPDGHTVEFLQYPPDSPVAKARGQSLGADRISSVMRHAGILVGALEPATAFYRDILGFKETWRGSSDGTVLSWVNLQMPDGDDYIEFMLYGDLPAETARGSAHHICLVVPNVPAAAAALQARAAKAGYTRPLEPRTGINRKRQLNLFDPDGTRSELMEANTVDGKATPSSSARPPK
jgi:catechol 2,3-dioxygenase-like lactoylglutathione lyase family enzyme